MQFFRFLTVSYWFRNLFSINLIFLIYTFFQLAGHFLLLWRRQLAMQYNLLERYWRPIRSSKLLAPSVLEIGFRDRACGSILGMCFWNSDNFWVLSFHILVCILVLLDANHFLCQTFGIQGLISYEITDSLFVGIYFEIAWHLLSFINWRKR